MNQKRSLDLRVAISGASSISLLTTVVILLALSTFGLSSTVHALTVAQANLINQGFTVFNTQTFNGNGRTCTTCHLPQADFDISPADLPTLSAHQQLLVFGSNTIGGLPGRDLLENPIMVGKLGLFNINDGVGGLASEIGTGVNPEGPFRASMAIGGLAFTTANLLPDFCASNATPTLIENGTDLVTVVCSPLPLDFPANATPFDLTDVFLNTEPPTFGTAKPGVDDGTRNIELGWAGDGAITDPDIFGPTTTLANQDCQAAVNDANDDTTDLTKSLRSFSLAAVKTHFTQTLNRTPGIDFRCPTSTELDALAAFQEYLGRQFEMALKQGVDSDLDDVTDTLTNFLAGTQVDASQPVITFNDSTAETGKAIFLDGNSQCNLCHFNAGANDATGLVHAPNPNDPSAPFPGRNFTSKQLVDLLRCTDASGSPSTCMNGSTATLHGLNAIVAPVVFPQDAGDKVANGATAFSLAGSDCNNGINSGGNTACVNGAGMKAGAFNLQPLIEAARKKTFFHNGAFNTLESAVSFYFSPTGDQIKAFTAPRKGETGAQALATLANNYFGNSSDTQQVLNTMAFFLRSLSAVYSLADCDRLINDSIGLIQQGQLTSLQSMLCTNDLQDVSNLISGAQVTLPNQYLVLRSAIPGLQQALQNGEQNGNVFVLERVENQLVSLRSSIATISPDVP
jgi:cytochrome c peroxidase